MRWWIKNKPIDRITEDEFKKILEIRDRYSISKQESEEES